MEQLECVYHGFCVLVVFICCKHAPRPVFLEALCYPCAHVRILHTTLQLLAKKTPISLLMLLLFGKTKREKAAECREHSSVLPGNAQSPPKAVRPHMCLVKGHFPRELRFEGKELHCLLPNHGIAHSVCQDCSSPVGSGSPRFPSPWDTHRLLCSHPLQSLGCLSLPCEYFGKSRDEARCTSSL